MSVKASEATTFWVRANAMRAFEESRIEQTRRDHAEAVRLALVAALRSALSHGVVGPRLHDSCTFRFKCRCGVAHGWLPGEREVTCSCGARHVKGES